MTMISEDDYVGNIKGVSQASTDIVDKITTEAYVLVGVVICFNVFYLKCIIHS